MSALLADFSNGDLAKMFLGCRICLRDWWLGLVGTLMRYGELVVEGPLEPWSRQLLHLLVPWLCTDGGICRDEAPDVGQQLFVDQSLFAAGCCSVSAIWPSCSSMAGASAEQLV